MKVVFALATVVATLVLGGAAQALPTGLGPGVPPVQEPLSVTSSVGNAAEGAVSGTLHDVARVPSLPATSEPAPSLLGPRDDSPDKVLDAAYRAFEDLVTAGPDAIVFRSAVVTTDAFSAPGIDGAVPGYSAGSLGAYSGPVVALFMN
jgi:hypothetical protein